MAARHRALVFWLAVLFASFSMFAPRNVTVISILLLLWASALMIFLILE